MPQKILILTTGGTIDKVYFDAKSEFSVGQSVIDQVLQEAEVGLEYRTQALMQKDSLELTDADRQMLHMACLNADEDKILITHGTDTMTQSAAKLKDIEGKTIVLTGSLSPARFRNTDALFNIGMAVATLQTAGPGTFICMNGQVFEADKVQKNLDLNRFESTNDSSAGAI